MHPRLIKEVVWLALLLAQQGCGFWWATDKENATHWAQASRRQTCDLAGVGYPQVICRQKMAQSVHPPFQIKFWWGPRGGGGGSDASLTSNSFVQIWQLCIYFCSITLISPGNTSTTQVCQIRGWSQKSSTAVDRDVLAVRHSNCSPITWCQCWPIALQRSCPFRARLAGCSTCPTWFSWFNFFHQTPFSHENWLFTQISQVGSFQCFCATFQWFWRKKVSPHEKIIDTFCIEILHTFKILLSCCEFWLTKLSFEEYLSPFRG